MKKLYINLAIFLVLAIQSCNSSLGEIELKKEFVKYYSEGNAVDIIKGNDGFVLVATGPNDDSFIIKTSATGDVIWESGIELFLVKDVLQLGSGEEYVLLGDYPGIGANDISIRYVDRSGVTASYRPDLGALGATRNTSDFFAVQMTFDPTDGNLIVVGESGDINGRTKPFIFKVDGQKVSWLYELGKDDPDADVQIAHSLIMDDGAAIVAYNVHDDLSEISAFVRIVSINMNTGQESSLSAITQLGDLFASEMIATSSGFAFTGASVFFTGSQKLHITLLDANAQITNSDVEIDKSVGSSIANTFDGGFVIGGSIRNFNNNDFLLLKTDPDGRLEWDEERVLGGESADETSKVLEVDNGYLLFGTSWIENTLARPTLIKTNRSGLLYE